MKKQTTSKAKKPAKASARDKPAVVRSKAGSKTEALAKELKSLIPRLDAEGLQFLIEQAQVHLYNMQADELNKTMERSAAAKAAKTGGKTKAAGAAPKAKEAMRLEGSASGSSFYIVYNGKWVMFSRDEMIRMVSIVSAPVSDLEVRENLFGWIERERRDLIESVPIADKYDERLKKIAALLKKNFKVKKQS
jgi:hypothetical protein